MSETHRTGGDRRSDARFALALALCHAIVVAIGLVFHEVWRDEWQAWLLARDSATIPQMLEAMRYEGHPPAWHLLLFFASRLTRSVAGMQALHLLIASSMVWVVARFSPFSRAQKLLFAFGAWPAYEFAVISRGYSLGALAFFAACAAWSLRRRTLLPLAACLALLALTSAYGAVLALAFAGAAAIEILADAELRAITRRRVAEAGAAALLVAVVVGTTVVQVRPPADADFTGRPATSAEPSITGAARQVALIPVRVLIPFPRFEHGAPFWGETEAVEGRAIENAPLLALVVLAGFGAYTLRRPAALALLLLGTGGLLYFAYRYHHGHLRHHGHLMLLIVAACWLARTDGEHWLTRRLPVRLRDSVDRAGAILFTALLLVHTATWAVLYPAELRHPFTAGKAAAQVMAANGADRLPVVGGSGGYAITIAGYLDRPVHYIEQGTTGTYVIWGQGFTPIPAESLLNRVRPLLSRAQPTLLLTSFEALPPEGLAGIRVDTLFVPAEPVLSPEVYHVYRVTLTDTVAEQAPF